MQFPSTHLSETSDEANKRFLPSILCAIQNNKKISGNTSVNGMECTADVVDIIFHMRVDSQRIKSAKEFLSFVSFKIRKYVFKGHTLAK